MLSLTSEEIKLIISDINAIISEFPLTQSEIEERTELVNKLNKEL